MCVLCCAARRSLALDEHSNPLGFYRKLKGAKLLVQVRRPGAEPDLSRFPPWEPAEGETRGWRLRDELPSTRRDYM